MWQMVKHSISQIHTDKILRVVMYVFVCCLSLVAVLSFLGNNQQENIFRFFVTTGIEMLAMVRILFSGAQRYKNFTQKNYSTLYRIHGISQGKVYLATIAGYVIMLLFVYIVMTITTCIIAYLYGIDIVALMIGFLGSMIKVATVLIITLVCATIARPLIAIVVAIVIYVLGHSSLFIDYMSQNAGSKRLSGAYKALYAVLPPFDQLSFTSYYFQ